MEYSKEVHNIVPDDIQDILSKYDDIEVHIDSLKKNGNNISIDFILRIGDFEFSESQKWQLEIINYCASNSLSLSNSGFFKFFFDHLLLWDEETELYFGKPCSSPELLLAELYFIHSTILEDLIPWKEYINIDFKENLMALGKLSYGLLARGPRRILAYYFKSLEKLQMEPYYHGTYEPKIWIGNQWVPLKKTDKLALLDKTYFIAENFKFIRLD